MPDMFLLLHTKIAQSNAEKKINETVTLMISRNLAIN